MSRKIILASTSPRRKELLAKTGLAFEICPGDYEEDMTLQMEPKELAKFLSLGKAQSVVSKFPDALIIGSDTFLSFEDKVLGKPHTPEKAKEMLQMLRGNMHSVLTGYAIIDTKNNKIINDVVETKVCFKNYSDQEIDEYIATGEPLERAGGYAIQEIGKKLVEKIDGDLDSAIGLPVKNILESLKEFEE
ncbi:MAG: nucleoside triphosphate pyrophosphatase [bacterium]